MTTLKIVTIAAGLLVGGTSLAMAQYGGWYPGCNAFRPRQILFARTKSAKFRDSVAFRIWRSQRIFACLQTVDWQDTDATTLPLAEG